MSERWTAVDGELIQPDGYSNGHMRDGRAADIAARLSGPSPAEVAALLRRIQKTPVGGVCVDCGLPLSDACAADCKLDAMIKQCEGA